MLIKIFLSDLVGGWAGNATWARQGSFLVCLSLNARILFTVSNVVIVMTQEVTPYSAVKEAVFCHDNYVHFRSRHMAGEWHLQCWRITQLLVFRW